MPNGGGDRATDDHDPAAPSPVPARGPRPRRASIPASRSPAAGASAASCRSGASWPCCSRWSGPIASKVAHWRSSRRSPCSHCRSITSCPSAGRSRSSSPRRSSGWPGSSARASPRPSCCAATVLIGACYLPIAWVARGRGRRGDRVGLALARAGWAATPRPGPRLAGPRLDLHVPDDRLPLRAEARRPRPSRSSTRSATSSSCRITASCISPSSTTGPSAAATSPPTCRRSSGEGLQMMSRRGPPARLSPGRPRAADQRPMRWMGRRACQLPRLQLPALPPRLGPVPHGLRDAAPLRLPAPGDAPSLPAGDRASPTTGGGSTSTGRTSWSGSCSTRSCSGSSAAAAPGPGGGDRVGVRRDLGLARLSIVLAAGHLGLRPARCAVLGHPRRALVLVNVQSTRATRHRKAGRRPEVGPRPLIRARRRSGRSRRSRSSGRSGRARTSPPGWRCSPGPGRPLSVERTSS